MFRDCRRKWAFRYVDGVEVDSNRFAQLGKQVHAVLENWLKNGEPPDLDTDEGRIAAAGLKHLPAPSALLDVEAHVQYRRKDTAYHGYSDLIQGIDVEIPVVTDHKTTVHFKWAKTEEDLLADVQSTIYSAAVLDITQGNKVINRWVYYRTRGKPASKVVEVERTVEDIERAMMAIDETAYEIYAAYKAAKPAEETEYDARACDHYGGCAYRDLCKLSAMDRIRSIMAKETLAEKMRRKKAEKAGREPTVPTGVINAPETAAAPQSLTDKIKGGKKKKSKVVEEVDHEQAAVDGAATAPAEADADPQAWTMTANCVPSNGASYTLFVNCMPVDPHPYHIMRAADVMGPAKYEVEKAAKVPDYRMVEFGRGPGMLAAALRDHMQKNMLPGSVAVLLDLRTDEGRHSLHAFEEFAGLVVRGM
jgi:CRISPR/Cas system-associated exonuclease Cas4 (RecB family)